MIYCYTHVNILGAIFGLGTRQIFLQPWSNMSVVFRVEFISRLSRVSNLCDVLWWSKSRSVTQMIMIGQRKANTLSS
jgi:hypothetical protein